MLVDIFSESSESNSVILSSKKKQLGSTMMPEDYKHIDLFTCKYKDLNRFRKDLKNSFSFLSCLPENKI